MYFPIHPTALLIKPYINHSKVGNWYYNNLFNVSFSKGYFIERKKYIL
jgi:hypothetical protein